MIFGLGSGKWARMAHPIGMLRLMRQLRGLQAGSASGHNAVSEPAKDSAIGTDW